MTPTRIPTRMPTRTYHAYRGTRVARPQHIGQKNTKYQISDIKYHTSISYMHNTASASRPSARTPAYGQQWRLGRAPPRAPPSTRDAPTADAPRSSVRTRRASLVPRLVARVQQPARRAQKTTTTAVNASRAPRTRIRTRAIKRREGEERDDTHEYCFVSAHSPPFSRSMLYE